MHFFYASFIRFYFTLLNNVTSSLSQTKRMAYCYSTIDDEDDYFMLLVIFNILLMIITLLYILLYYVLPD